MKTPSTTILVITEGEEFSYVTSGTISTISKIGRFQTVIATTYRLKESIIIANIHLKTAYGLTVWNKTITLEETMSWSTKAVLTR